MSVGSLGIRVFTSAIPGRLAHGLQRVQVPCQAGRRTTRARGSPPSSYFGGVLRFSGGVRHGICRVCKYRAESRFSGRKNAKKSLIRS